MTVLIVYNLPLANASTADSDVLKQVEWLEATLASMSVDSRRCACTLNLETLNAELTQPAPSIVFYLVESLGGTDGLFYMPADLIEARRIPATGSPAATLRQLASKAAVKGRLLDWLMPTAAWMDSRGSMSGRFESGEYIIKADLEHASLGIDESSIISAATVAELRRQLLEFQRKFDRPCLAEKFISGREFNISLLDYGDGTPEVLPLAEIDFSNLPSEKPRIVGWKAKWDDTSLEFHNTPRHYPNLIDQQELSEQLRRRSIECWDRWNLRGYARVDFRVATDGKPWILEINANPCLSPDAGFYAAAKQRGLSDEAIVGRIISAATHERPRAV